ncbi:MAG: radical SAM protein [bacterium]|nr:radical SAM protein [bacterium]
MKINNRSIVFVYPPATLSSDTHISAHFNMCLGSAYNIAYLLQEGFAAEPFLTGKPVNLSQSVKEILAMKPAVVGFTVYNSNYCLCQLIARALKEVAPDMIIVFGGPTASVQAEVILKNNPFVDICVRHEGEETCLEMFTLLEQHHFCLKKVSLENVLGITYRAGGAIRENPGRDILLGNRKIPDFLDKYPSPYLSGVLNTVSQGIVTARGCNQHCIYCNCAVMSKRIIATHSIDRVIRELDFISHKIKNDDAFTGNIDIFDDAFTLIPERAKTICNKIIENKIKLPLSCSTRCDMVNEELLDKMKEAGFKAIGYSLESAVPRILRILGKVQNPRSKADDTFEKEKEFIEKFKIYSKYAKKIGIDTVFASIMVGLPTETPAEAEQSVALIRALGESIDYYAHNIFQVFPGTPIFDDYSKYEMTLQEQYNRLHFKTIHTYEARKIKPAPKSSFQQETLKQDKANIKTMALELPEERPARAGYFNRVILFGGIITEELIAWLQKYLAINGPLIQIYPHKAKSLQQHEENGNLLHKYISPTTYHAGYFRTVAKDGTETFTPIRRLNYGEECGLAVDLVKTSTGLSTPEITASQCICVDKEKEDVLQLFHLLVELSSKENAPDYLFDNPLYPYLSSLCRWETGAPNCRTLETVIIDSDNNIKTCWNGEPVGTVGTPLPAILENLERIRRETAKRRACGDCVKKGVCVKCIFPQPLPAGEYCGLKKEFNTEAPAELLRKFDIFKDLE